MVLSALAQRPGPPRSGSASKISPGPALVPTGAAPPAPGRSAVPRHRSRRPRRPAAVTSRLGQLRHARGPEPVIGAASPSLGNDQRQRRRRRQRGRQRTQTGRQPRRVQTGGHVGRGGPGQHVVERAQQRRCAAAAARCGPPASPWSCRSRRAPSPSPPRKAPTPTSTRRPGRRPGFPSAASGEMYRAVPTIAPAGSVHAASASARATPKSATRTRPSSSNKRLAGLMSRCTSPRGCA